MRLGRAGEGRISEFVIPAQSNLTHSAVSLQRLTELAWRFYERKASLERVRQ